MQAKLVEYAQRDSVLHRMDARWKLAALVLCSAAVISLQTITAAAIALVAAIVLIALSRLPFAWFVARLGGVAFIVSTFLIVLPLTMPGEDWTLGPLTISKYGLQLALLICLKALAVVALALLLFATSPLETTLKAARSLYAPSLLVQLLLLTYRYIFLLGDELHKLRLTLRLRGYRNRASAHCYRTIGHVAGTLLVRSYERAERVAQAMRCRGFDGQLRSLHSFRSRPADVVKFSSSVLLAAGLWLWDLQHVRDGL